VLADPWLYASWVVGASRIRDVQGNWPEVDAVIHHSVGAWPMLLNDTTSVTECVPGRRLELRARGWPLGEADVVVLVEEDARGCLVTMREWAARGPGTVIPKPLFDPVVHWRNVESLRRLALIAEGQARQHADETSGPAAQEI
jgi:hypothetical protein